MIDSFRGLSYTYPGSNEAALHNVSFDLEEGQILAIVGFNGSGKSPIFKIDIQLTNV